MNFTITVLETDNNCNTSKIVGRVEDALKGLAKPGKVENCKSRICECDKAILLSDQGGSGAFDLGPIDVAAVGHCWVKVHVQYSYTGGSGYIGACRATH